MDNEQFQEFVVKHLMNLSTDVSSLEKKFSSLTSTVTRIETRMENELIDKMKILFEGYKLHDDRLNRHEKEINNLKYKLGSR